MDAMHKCVLNCCMCGPACEYIDTSKCVTYALHHRKLRRPLYTNLAHN